MMASLWAQAVAGLSEKDQAILRSSSADPSLILRDILADVEEQRNRCQQGRRKIRGLQGEEIFIRDLCAKITRSVKMFIEVADVVVQFDPVHSALPWAGLRFLLQLSLNNSETFEAVGEGLERVSGLIARFAIVEFLYLPAKSEGEKMLRKTLLNLYVAVLRFLIDSRKYFKQNKTVRLITAVVSRKKIEDAIKKVISIEADLEFEKGLVDSERNLKSASNVDELLASHQKLRDTLYRLEAPIGRAIDQIEQLHNLSQEMDKSALLERLSNLPVHKHHNAMRSSLLPESGQWLLDDFEDWLDVLGGILKSDREPLENSAMIEKLHGAFSTPPSPLFVICSFGLSEVLDYPGVLAGLDLEQRNNSETSGLYLAARWGHTCAVKKLLELGVNANSPGYQFGNALLAAAFGGHPDVVTLLVQNGASSCGSNEFSSPFQAALVSGQDLTLSALLKAGLQFPTQQQFDDAFETASSKGHAEIIERLLSGEMGSFVPKVWHDSLQDALYTDKVRKAKRLLRECPDINASNGVFGNALQAAVAGGNLGLVEAVINAGAKLDIRGSYGYPLRAAAVLGKADIVDYLIRKGANVHAEDQLGNALQAAASKGHVDIMKILLLNNAATSNALEDAVLSRNEQAVKILLDHGADANSPGRLFPTALDAATYADNDGTISLLRAQGARLAPSNQHARRSKACVIL